VTFHVGALHLLGITSLARDSQCQPRVLVSHCLQPCAAAPSGVSSRVDLPTLSSPCSTEAAG
jgi:hypothetical protein